MQKYLSILRSRMPVLAALLAVLLALWIGTSIRGSVFGAWHLLRLPALTPLFADTRTITHSIDCLLSGQDPYTVRTFDPWQRVYNYPPIWLDLRYLGVTSQTSNLLGLIFAAMSVTAFLVLFNARTWITALIVFFTVTSKAILFAVERGNTDQVIFFLLVVSVFLIDRVRTNRRPVLKSALIVFLTVLKIYPVAAVAILMRNRKGALLAFVTAALSIAALVITCGHRIAQVLANTPQKLFASFGALPFFLAILRHAPHPLFAFVLQHPKTASLGALVLAALSMLAGIQFREQFDYFLPSLDFDDTRGCIAVAGLAIFCVAFSRGASFDYRLIFLLGAIACLVDDLNKRISLRSLPAATLLVLLLWKPRTPYILFELLDGFVFVVAAAWLGTSLLKNMRASSSHSPSPSTIP
jgi:hypothetical protein